jgi:uncharacterized protein YndB with AHSA1/START domain
MKKNVTIERTYDASIEDVWALWTTKEGIESWWGPDGFTVEVIEIDVRPGGQLHYAMTATAPPQIAFMKQAGMPLSTKTRLRYVEVERHKRIACANLVDFVPGMAAYEVTVSVDFAPAPNGVRLVLNIAPMHDEMWTGRMVAGWEAQLGKLAGVIAARKSK